MLAFTKCDLGILQVLESRYFMVKIEQVLTVLRMLCDCSLGCLELLLATTNIRTELMQPLGPGHTFGLITIMLRQYQSFVIGKYNLVVIYF